MEEICVSWNNSQADIANCIRKLRENEKLFDVTLVTDDGQHIQAHKIILAAGSLFFEDIFIKSNHSNMLIYLKGIHSCELEQVLNFLYTGEAIISHEGVKVFLETAKELQVKGIEDYDSFVLTPDQEVNDYNNGYEAKKETVKNGEASEKFINAVSAGVGVNDMVETIEDDSQQTTEVKLEDRAGFDEFPDEQEKGVVRTPMDPVQVNKNKELDAQVQQLLMKKDGLWECKICGKTSLYKNHMRQHTETHIEGVSHTCHICSKTFGSRHNLRGHISGIHSELFTCDVCGKSGMNKYSYRAHQQRQHQIFSVRHQ